MAGCSMRSGLPAARRDVDAAVHAEAPLRSTFLDHHVSRVVEMFAEFCRAFVTTG